MIGAAATAAQSVANARVTQHPDLASAGGNIQVPTAITSGTIKNSNLQECIYHFRQGLIGLRSQMRIEELRTNIDFQAALI